MKLIKVMLMISLFVFAFIVMACSASADEIRLVFENEDFETVYSSDGETARAVLYSDCHHLTRAESPRF